MAPDEKGKQPEQLHKEDAGDQNASAAPPTGVPPAAAPPAGVPPAAVPPASVPPTAAPGPVRPPPPPGLEPLPAIQRLPLPPPALSSWPPPAPAGAQSPSRPATAQDIRAALASPAMDYFRQLLFRTPDLGSDPEQYEVIAAMYNELHVAGTIVDAVLYLEAAWWNFGQALDDWARDERLRGQHAQGELTEDLHNSRLDRSNARGGAHFTVGKLNPVVSTGKEEVRGEFDHDTFDEDNPRHILRLNRQRQEFFDRTIGPLPCPPQGRQGDWWHELEKWEVERRYVLKDRNADGFPGWVNMADDHNRGFKNRRLPGLLDAPPFRIHNKITQHINRSGLNKQKEKGPERHKLAQADINAKHQVQRKALQAAWDDRFSSTLEDRRILDEEDKLAREAAAAVASKAGKDVKSSKAAKTAAETQQDADDMRDAADMLLNLYSADQRETRSSSSMAKAKAKKTDKGKGKAKESDEEDDDDDDYDYDEDY